MSGVTIGIQKFIVLYTLTPGGISVLTENNEPFEQLSFSTRRAAEAHVEAIAKEVIWTEFKRGQETVKYFDHAITDYGDRLDILFVDITEEIRRD